MELNDTLKFLRFFCYVTCLSLFVAWLINAVENYVSMPTTTKYTLKYGDDGKKNARFPLVSICRMPSVSNGSMKLWNNAEPCKNMSVLSKPYFLSYLETCLENDKDQSVTELIDKVTYDIDQVFRYIITFPSKATKLNSTQAWQKHKKQIVTSNFHYEYGNCQTIDISSLSEDNGMFPMEFGSNKMTLFMDYQRVEIDVIFQYFFLHNHTNINQFGKDIRSQQFTGGDIRVSLTFWKLETFLYLANFCSQLFLRKL